MAAKNVILRKKIAGVLYDLIPQTLFSQVLNTDGKTLDAVVTELTTAIAACATDQDLSDLETRFNTLIADAPEAYDTLKEISEYIKTHTSEYEALLAISADKVDKVEGMGLSTNDFTDELKTKLDDLYTKAQLDTKFSDVEGLININTGAIATLNANDQTVGSVDYKIKAAQDALTGNIGDLEIKVDKNIDDIAAINNEATGILAVAKAYTDTEVATKGTVYASTEEPANLTDNDLWIYYQE